MSIEQRLAKLEMLTSPTENKDGPKVVRVEKLSTKEWNDYVTHRENYRLEPLPGQADNGTVLMKFVKGR